MAVNPSPLSSSLSPHCSPFFDRSVSSRFPFPFSGPLLPKSTALLHEVQRSVSYIHFHKPDCDPAGLSSGDAFLSNKSMDPKGSSDPIAPSISVPPSAAIDFLTLCHSLKKTKRTGWINHGIKGSESIADHMYRMALMSLISDDLPSVNRERCIKMAIVHDIAEAIVGDITPSDGVPKEEKSRREEAALNQMCNVLGGGMRAEEIKELWAEYENNSSSEANIVKDFDKVEMILQALEYETEHGVVLDEFFRTTAGKIHTDIGKSWAAEITSRRNLRLENKGK